MKKAPPPYIYCVTNWGHDLCFSLNCAVLHVCKRTTFSFKFFLEKDEHTNYWQINRQNLCLKKSWRYNYTTWCFTQVCHLEIRHSLLVQMCFAQCKNVANWSKQAQGYNCYSHGGLVLAEKKWATYLALNLIHHEVIYCLFFMRLILFMRKLLKPYYASSLRKYSTS